MIVVFSRGSFAVLLVALAGLVGCMELGPPPDSLPPPDGLHAVLEEGDARLAKATRQDALERHVSGKPASWNNPVTGSAGTITPISTFRTSTGYFCRRYQETVEIRSAATEFEIAVACRDDTGVWRKVIL